MKKRLCCAFVLISFLGIAGIDCHQARGQAAADKVEDLGGLTYLKVDTIKVVRRNNLLNLQVEIVSLFNGEQRLYYRFKWFDDAGFTVGSEETWKPEVIYGAQRKIIQTVAPVPAAVDFRLELQGPDNPGMAPEVNN